MKPKILFLILLTASLTMAQGRGGSRMMTWDESLNLTTEQMQQITELRESMEPAMIGMRQNTRTLQLELRQLNRSDDPDAARIAELEAALAANQTAMDAFLSGHRDQIRALLTEDQQLIFDQHNFGPDEGRGNRRNANNRNNSGGNRGMGSGPGRP